MTNEANTNMPNADDRFAIFSDLVFATRPQRALRLDIRVPRWVRNPPLVVYIPMGGMRACPKANAKWWLGEHGFAMASIECRCSNEAIAPAPVHDSKAAVRWLRANAGSYGYNGESMGAWGHSAGGLLSALVATSGDAPEVEDPDGPAGVSSRVQAACDECGAPHDFAYFARPDIKARFAPVAENVRLYLGGAADERPELARLVSPSTYVSSSTPPMLLIHGTADAIVPVEETEDFHKLLLAAGVDSTLRLLSGAGHGWDDALTRDQIVRFFERTLAGR